MSDLLTQEGLLKDIKKRKQLENLYKKKMAKVEPIVPDLQLIQSKYIVTDTDLPFLKRQTGESDEDYNRRMEQLKVNNSEVLEKYYEQNINLLKKNLSTLIPNQQQINELVGELSKEPKDIVLMNSYWKKFKKSLNDNFDSISFADFVLFLNNFLEILNKPNEIEDESGNMVAVDKAKELENIDIGIDDEVNRFLAASQIIQNKSNVPQIRAMPKVAYDPSQYPDLDELGRDKATMRQIRRSELSAKVGNKLRRVFDIQKVKQVLDKEDYAANLKDLFTEIKEDEEKKNKEAKELDEKSKSIDSKTPKIEVIKSDKIKDEGISSTPVVEKIAEKEKGLTPKKEKNEKNEKKKKEKLVEEAVKKIAKEESGFAPIGAEEPPKEEPPKKEPTYDLFTNEDVVKVLKDRITDYGGITDFSKREYKDRYSVRGQKDESNKEFVKNISTIMSTLDPISAGKFKKKLQQHLKEEDIIRFLVPYVTNYKNNLIKDGKTKDDVNYITRDIFGFGLDKSKKIVPMRFGRYILNKNKLDNQNLLQVLHENSLNQVKFFKSTYISDDMKDLIYYIVEKKSFSPKLYKMLDSSEQDLFNSLIEKSGLKAQLNINLGNKYSDSNKVYKDLKEQYEILTSQIESGNDSPILQKELNKVTKDLKQIITYLSKVGQISKSNATNMILAL